MKAIIEQLWNLILFMLLLTLDWIAFQVDMYALKQMRDIDIKELGIPMVMFELPTRYLVFPLFGP